MFFLFLFFSSLFFVSPPFSLSSYYILWFFTPFPPSTCESGVGSLFSLLHLPLLEPSILSCKAACSLFRHHLHINAARELAGQHLMRGQQYSQIFVFSHFYPLSDIFFHSLCCKVCSRRYLKRLISLLATSDTVKSYISILYLFSECNFHLFLYWSSSDTLLSSDWVLDLTLSNAVCTYEIGY